MISNGMGMGYNTSMGGGQFGGINGGNAYAQGYSNAYGNTPVSYQPQTTAVNTAQIGAPLTPAGGRDLTGTFLGAAAPGQAPAALPGVIPNPFDNTLLIRATPQEYEQILNLLRSLDLPPRQVLIDAKIYEVDLTDDLAGGVECLPTEGRHLGGRQRRLERCRELRPLPAPWRLSPARHGVWPHDGGPGIEEP